MIDLNGVRKVCSVKGGNEVAALDNVTLHVDHGSIHGIVGQSGAGKSTLIRCLTALEHPTEGAIIVDGLDLMQLRGKKLRGARRRIDMVFQSANLLDGRTAAENIGYPLKLAGAPKAQVKARAAGLLSLIGPAGYGNSYPSQLSRGQRQRVGTARALADNPAVLLCDEPTSALDTDSTRQILDLLTRVRDSEGVTVLVITHEMAVVREICDSVTLLGHGVIIRTGAIEEIIIDPTSPLSRELIPAPSVDEVDLCGDTSPLDAIFAPRPGVPTGVTVLSLTSSMGADVTAGTFESMDSTQIGRLALSVPSYHAQKIIDKLHEQNIYAEMRSARA